jgi:chromosome segregation ATPase
MKRPITSLIAVLITVAASVGVAVASPALPSPTPKATIAPSAEQSARLNRLKTHGGSELDRRLDNLQKTAGKITLSTKLGADDKKKIEDQLQGEINTLIALKSRMSGETDLIAARQDVQSLIAEYNVYGLLYPKGRLIATADRMIATGSTYELLRSNLQHKITAAKQAGKDVTKLQATLDDMRVKLADAKARYQPLTTKVLDLPKDYAAAYQVLAAQRDGLKTARTDFKQLRDDAQMIMEGLRNLKAATPSPSPSPSASAVPSPAAH